MVEKVLRWKSFRSKRHDVLDLHLRYELNGIFCICLYYGNVRPVSDRSVCSKKAQIIWHFCITKAEIRRYYSGTLPRRALVLTVDEKGKLKIVGCIKACGTDDNLSASDYGRRPIDKLTSTSCSTP